MILTYGDKKKQERDYVEMTVLRRQIVNVPFDELSDVEKVVGRLVSINVDNMPEQFRGTFADTKRIAYRNYTILTLFQSFKVLELRNGLLTLEDGIFLNLGEVAGLFADAFEVGFLVASLKDYGHKVTDYLAKNNSDYYAKNGSDCSNENDMLEELFLDAWGTALIGSGEKWSMEYIRKKVVDQGLHMTNSFGPGQGGIPLEMQSVIVEKMQASEIGVSINAHFMMTPKKTVTGIFGIQKKELTDLLKPCDICNLSDVCPTAYA